MTCRHLYAAEIVGTLLPRLILRYHLHMNEKRLIALKLLASKGLKRSVYEPHHLRLLWYFGFDMPPPHFASFLSNILINGTFFGLLWGILRGVLEWFQGGVFQGIDTEAVVIVGAVYGIGMAAYYAYSRRRNGLPTWHGLGS